MRERITDRENKVFVAELMKTINGPDFYIRLSSDERLKVAELLFQHPEMFMAQAQRFNQPLELGAEFLKGVEVDALEKILSMCSKAAAKINLGSLPARVLQALIHQVDPIEETMDLLKINEQLLLNRLKQGDRINVYKTYCEVLEEDVDNMDVREAFNLFQLLTQVRDPLMKWQSFPLKISKLLKR